MPSATATPDLFAAEPPPSPSTAWLGPQTAVLRGFALPAAGLLLDGIARIAAQAPWRRMQTPGGYTMSVAVTNCGAFGWTSDRRGYRYGAVDPLTGHPWPALPPALLQLAGEAAAAAGFGGFVPDACLVNCYAPGARLSLHQDRDERDFGAPIVSVSLGMRATFLFGGLARADKPVPVPLEHGDVVVWGGVDRLRFHGVRPLHGAPHPVLGERRINLTFRRAG
ncbi:DNA oxidative demethylase AlkB [Xylophilus sp.]|uniref:DNA oxidative demethylase AlkB n=1 Tax=Xylophilus sp. TaxID=2653893 RepID=UPI0013BC90C0|nr:DNA oxidative demethylase AlkB [Xylophilus sp.]KAF1044204.1 MAG: Alpha-ketoglutarate-dependent dioxygenase AlkB [Xylophilus sp.]